MVFFLFGCSSTTTQPPQQLPPLVKPDYDVENPSKSNSYNLINTLNRLLNNQFNGDRIEGIERVSTIQKNRQIIIQVIHDPEICYSNLIKEIAQSAGRVNGINFQNSMTLNIVDRFCDTNLFYIMRNQALKEEIIVQYKDLNGNQVATHTINQQLCKI
ncbi:hypothetical protein THMIRHAM_14100 [Thiomicrorhabdus immobilis]|uniref:Uncharacterized protein n=1 Tax=Thiomicrorhabdus immobilis TaxID=2791037 RepID=A0ABN6CWW9_9GAMM|nr:hypothetical protein [Thiomicrorhabdus immobilis]BCN93625.1 hypothetical protein THMIRHAM_14100 [Thiomicrorhabdus immobilis]